MTAVLLDAAVACTVIAALLLITVLVVLADNWLHREKKR